MFLAMKEEQFVLFIYFLDKMSTSLISQSRNSLVTAALENTARCIQLVSVL